MIVRSSFAAKDKKIYSSWMQTWRGLFWTAIDSKHSSRVRYTEAADTLSWLRTAARARERERELMCTHTMHLHICLFGGKAKMHQVTSHVQYVPCTFTQKDHIHKVKCLQKRGCLANTWLLRLKHGTFWVGNNWEFRNWPLSKLRPLTAANSDKQQNIN